MGRNTAILGNMALLCVSSGNTRELALCSDIHSGPRAEVLGSKRCSCHLATELGKRPSLGQQASNYLSMGEIILTISQFLWGLWCAQTMDGRRSALNVREYHGCECDTHETELTFDIQLIECISLLGLPQESTTS